MQLIYRFALFCYTCLIHIAAGFHPKAKKWVQGRVDWRNKVREKVSGLEGRKIWMHCASLGEFEQGRTILESFRLKYPAHKIILTFFSPSGYEIRKNTPLADAVLYLPADSPKNSFDFIELIKPSVVFFVKYEFWNFFGRELHRRKIPFYCISANFRPGQIFFRPIGGFFRKMLLRYSHIFVQDQASLSLLYKAGITNVTVAGDTRFDTVWENSTEKIELPLLESFCSSHPQILVAGSTWPQDELLLFETLMAVTDLKIILAPHEISQERIDAISKRFGSMAVFYSKSDVVTLIDKRVLVIDNIGMLSKLYRFGQYAYVGGGFGAGIHNTLEAAVYGKPVFFGPNHHRFREAKELIRNHVAYPVSQSAELILHLGNFSRDATKLRQISEKALHVMQKNRGATNVIMEYVHMNYGAVAMKL
jgi:3-deoxy-D-manno-octulosonic-acid transferase